jgi:beta-glucosidase
VGETSDSSVESKDRADTHLPPEQIRLIEAVTAVNPRTAIVANVGHAFDTGWDATAAALMVAWYPGQEFGHALAAVLAGDREPGGRLPVSIAMREHDYPALGLTPQPNGDLHYSEGTRLGYRGLAASNAPPRHAFGAGFGYARFAIGDVAVRDTPDGLLVTARVHNLSARHGAEVVQVYRAEPELTLIGFIKVALNAGAAGEATIRLPARRFAVWNGGWLPWGPRTTLLVGRSSAEIVWSEQIITPR